MIKSKTLRHGCSWQCHNTPLIMFTALWVRLSLPLMTQSGDCMSCLLMTRCHDSVLRWRFMTESFLHYTPWRRIFEKYSYQHTASSNASKKFFFSLSKMWFKQLLRGECWRHIGIAFHCADSPTLCKFMPKDSKLKKNKHTKKKPHSVYSIPPEVSK